MPARERPAFTVPEHTGARAVDRSQESIEELVALIRGCPLLYGILLPKADEVGNANTKLMTDGRLAYTLGAGATALFDHRLGRAPIGFIATMNQGWSDAVMEVYDAVVDRTKQLKLTNNAATTLDFNLWVF